MEKSKEIKKISFPLFGIIVNWEGLAEKNYLYTADELKRFEPQFYEDIVNSDDHLAESGIRPNITWVGTMLNTEAAVRNFLTGKQNEFPSISEINPQYEELKAEWYWESVVVNDMYGFHSNTMENAICALGIDEQRLTGDINSLN